MGKSGRKKRAAPADDGLKPKPPEKLQNLLWFIRFGRKHPWLTALFALLCVVGVAVPLIITKPSWLGGRETAPVGTFKFANFDDAELRRMVEESTGLKHKMTHDVTYVIGFTHSGQLRPAYQQGYYLFDGGTGIVLINGAECCRIEELALTPWADSPGNPKHDLETEIRKELERKLKSRRELIVECILQCIGNDS